MLGLPFAHFFDRSVATVRPSGELAFAVVVRDPAVEFSLVSFEADIVAAPCSFDEVSNHKIEESAEMSIGRFSDFVVQVVEFEIEGEGVEFGPMVGGRLVSSDRFDLKPVGFGARKYIVV